MDKGMRRELAIVAAIAAVSLALRAAFALSTDLLPDEALYAWTGTQGISFCPHPPVLPMTIRLGQALFGRGMLALRWGTLLWGTAGIVMAYVLGRRLYGGRAGVWAAGLFAVCPLFLAAGALATPDAPLLVLWLLLMYTGWRAMESGGAAWWLATGVVLAAGLYTKYMMVLALPAGLAAMLVTREGRGQLRRPWPWVGALLGLAMFVPVFLLWDWRNDWTALKYHLVTRHHWVWRTDGGPEYVLGHALFISPVLWVGALAALLWAWRRWRGGDARGAWVAAFGLAPIAFFLVPSIFTRRHFTREHWDAVGYAAAIVVLAGYLADASAPERSQRRRRLWGNVGVGIALLIGGTVLLGALMPNATARLGVRPTMFRALGWRELSAHVRDVMREHEADHLLLAGDSWITALSLDFYLGGEAHVYTLPNGRNERYGLVEQIHRWGLDWQSLVGGHAGRNVLYVHAYDGPEPDPTDYGLSVLPRMFALVEPAGDFTVEAGGRQLKCFGLFICRGLRAEVAPGRGPAGSMGR